MALVTLSRLGAWCDHIAAMIDLPRGVAVIFLPWARHRSFRSAQTFGGLFTPLIGALGGRLFANLMSAAWPSLGLDPHIYAIIGMGALSASVIGAPLTMTFIALETTGDFWLTAAVLIAVIISTQVTRELFGYSFATWRFHLRGEHPQRSRYRLASRADRPPDDADRRARSPRTRPWALSFGVPARIDGAAVVVMSTAATRHRRSSPRSIRPN
jgi:hypothetical protein